MLKGSNLLVPPLLFRATAIFLLTPFNYSVHNEYMIDFNNAAPQKEFSLDQNSHYTVKDANKLTGVALKRIYDLVETGIISPHSTVHKGDGVRNFTYYDSINILEIYLVGRLSGAGIPKRTIKEFFASIKSIRDSLNPKKISSFDGVAFLVFTHNPDFQIDFQFLSAPKGSTEPTLSNLKGKSIYTVVNLSELVVELFSKIDSLR